MVSRGRGEAGLGEDQRDRRKAEAHDREDAERGGKLILVQERGDEAHHNADAAAQYHVIDEALPGGKPLALSGAGVLGRSGRVLPKARRVTTARMKTVMPGRSVVAGPALPMTGSSPMQ